MNLFNQITSLFNKISKPIIKQVLLLYHTANADTTPLWAKSMIYSSLGYFVLPLDAIPDLLPFGFVDDIALLASTFAIVEVYITDEIKDQVELIINDFT